MTYSTAIRRQYPALVDIAERVEAGATVEDVRASLTPQVRAEWDQIMANWRDVIEYIEKRGETV